LVKLKWAPFLLLELLERVIIN